MKILIAEDNKTYSKILEKTMLKLGYEVILAFDGREALKILGSNNPPDLAILDYIMPELDGIEVCRTIRKQRKEPYIYIIMLTALEQEEILIEAMEAGVDDFVFKPVSLKVLQARLLSGKRILNLQKNLIDMRNTLQIKAMNDSLTGILNHKAIIDRLHQELARSCRENNPVGILLIDGDNFK